MENFNLKSEYEKIGIVEAAMDFPYKYGKLEINPVQYGLIIPTGYLADLNFLRMMVKAMGFKRFWYGLSEEQKKLVETYLKRKDFKEAITKADLEFCDGMGKILKADMTNEKFDEPQVVEEIVDEPNGFELHTPLDDRTIEEISQLTSTDREWGAVKLYGHSMAVENITDWCKKYRDKPYVKKFQPSKIQPQSGDNESQPGNE